MNNEQAFPNPHRTDMTGMTLRDYFAGLAMQKLMGSADVDDCCKSAFMWADAMLKAREA
jgi:hypothetical protein